MKEILLCKYGEIVLKGANRKYFEDMLCKTLRFRARHYGKFLVTRSQSTIIIEPQDDAADIDGMFDSARKVFGIVGISRCAVCEKNMDRIRETVREYVPHRLADAKRPSRWRQNARTSGFPWIRWKSGGRSAARFCRSCRA